MPIHTSESKFWRALHKPGEDVSLKEVFDNLKNYAVCGAMYVVGARVHTLGTAWWEKGAWIVLSVLALALGLLCFLQSWVLVQKALYWQWPFKVLEHKRAPVRFWLKYAVLLLVPLVIFATAVAAARVMSHQAAFVATGQASEDDTELR